jgi:hypothetical protein
MWDKGTYTGGGSLRGIHRSSTPDDTHRSSLSFLNPCAAAVRAKGARACLMRIVSAHAVMARITTSSWSFWSTVLQYTGYDDTVNYFPRPRYSR